MATTPKPKIWTPREETLYESRREREFYRYYEPIRELTGSGPPLCDLHDATAVEAHLPFSSPDRALTAFCQLGALRLGTRRAMMFFFDRNYAYILAEATRTLSLENDSVHEIDDALWMGHSIIPRGFSVCEHTVNLPLNQGSNRDDPSAGLVHIINDLTGDTRFCDMAYVKGGPLARFYAGVPIITPKGLSIGAYCVLDDKPRDGLDDKGITFLRDMSATIMTHLQMVRSSFDNKRSAKMVSGLSAFVAGASSLREQKVEKEISRSSPSSSVIENLETASGNPISSPNEESRSITIVDAFAKPPAGSPKKVNGFQVSSSSPVIGSNPHRNESLSSNDTTVDDSRKQSVASNVKEMFERVARVVREAVDVDGALYLDASIASYAGLLDSAGHPASSEQNSESGLSESEAGDADTEDHSNGNSSEENTRHEPCYVLSSSVAPDSEVNVLDSSKPSKTTLLEEKFLHRLLHKYPRGKIWNFNEEGDASSDDESSTACISPKSNNNETIVSEGHKRKISTRKTKRRSRMQDGSRIRRLFPGVRSLSLVGLWDHIKGRWFAACLVWTYSPLRILSEECEVNFLTAFGDSIMAEVHRLEVQNADKAKTDFISSISHELRSPLHGILGSVECLQEQQFDSVSNRLISQVEVCGRTLLDIVNHLLDFSKINSYASAQNRGARNDHRRQRLLSIADLTSRIGAEITLDADVSLDLITEEVVQTAFYSFCCSKDQDLILQRKVAFILDIDRSPETNWKCRIAIGGWKRICMNLVSNALKYTTDGYIHVTLKYAALRHTKTFNAVLSISDTGRGMSQDFLANYLFKPFSQEDHLAEGTGLGMSLVAKIVKALGGKIDVRSEKDSGTTITVTLPLGRGSNGTQIDSVIGIDPFNDLSVAIFEPAYDSEEQHAPEQLPRERGNALLRASLKTISLDLGILIQDATLVETMRPALIFILEPDLSHWKDLTSRGVDCVSAGSLLMVEDIPRILICNNAISERRLRSAPPYYLPRVNTEFVSLPIGPSRLAEAVHRCLHLKSSSSDANKLTAQPASASSGDSLTLESQTSADAKYQSDLGLPLSLIRNARTPDRSPNDKLSSLAGNRIETHLDRTKPSENISDQLSVASLGPTNGFVEMVGSFSQPVQQDSIPKDVANKEKLKELCILLVDDNQINLQLLVTYAKKRKYRQVTATDGLQAVETYIAACVAPALIELGGASNDDGLTQRPHVVLMDLNMPVLDGFEATRRIRQFERQERLEPATIVALTGLGSADARQQAYSSGIDLFLTKPVRLKELTRLLEGLMNS